jgi:hypothetical protein
MPILLIFFICEMMLMVLFVRDINKLMLSFFFNGIISSLKAITITYLFSLK